MRIDVISIFPEYLAPLQLSLLGKAQQAGLVYVQVHDLRDYAHDRHRTVDDTPAGGGAGMVMRPEPWGEALDAVSAPQQSPVSANVPALPVLVVPSPSGTPLTHALAADLATRPWLVIACGRYEGIDERVLIDAQQRMPVMPVSIGDYVLAGGESAALVLIEAVTRLIPGVLGNVESLVDESHTGGLLEYPVYTKPQIWRELSVPEVLTIGHHAHIGQWRQRQRLIRTAQRRPELLARWLATRHPDDVSAADTATLAELGWEPAGNHWRHAATQAH